MNEKEIFDKVQTLISEQLGVEKAKLQKMQTLQMILVQIH